MTFRPRRSVLYMPGSNARAIEKARTLPVDGVILDLEDAVAPEAKEQARQQVADAVKAGGFGGREVFIRVNGIDTPWHADDLNAAAHAGARRHPGAEGRQGRNARTGRPAPARHEDRSQDPHLGDDRDAGGDLQHQCAGRGGARFRDAARGLRHGHQRSRQGDAGAARARPRADGVVAARCACSRRTATASTSSTASTTTSAMPKGFEAECAQAPRHGLRRQDADPSEPDRALQQRVLAERRRGRARAQAHRRVRSAREQGQGRGAGRRPHGRDACTPRWRGARSRSPTRSSWRKAETRSLVRALFSAEIRRRTDYARYSPG